MGARDVLHRPAAPFCNEAKTKAKCMQAHARK
jgi:hypothetical protein